MVNDRLQYQQNQGVAVNWLIPSGLLFTITNQTATLNYF